MPHPQGPAWNMPEARVSATRTGRARTDARVYSHTGLDLASLGFAEASPDEATLTLVVPADPTIWATSAACAEHRGAPTGTRIRWSSPMT